MDDRTKDYDYARLVAEEKEHFLDEPVTDRLTLGGIHAHGAWEHYWRRVDERVRRGFGDIAAFIRERWAGLDRPVRILSLGSGWCGVEIALAGRLGVRHEITCTDLNPACFEKAKVVARERSLALRFEAADLNFMEIGPAGYDVVFAHASLHHTINLERLFAEVARGLAPRGVFHLVEVVGRNRKLLWEDSERFARALLKTLPWPVRRWTRFRVKPHASGMEGIRQEEILPVLRRYFEPVYELLHGAFMRFVCTHRKLGPRLDPADPGQRRHLDFLIDADESAVRLGLLRPLEVWGVYSPRAGPAE